MAKESEGVLGPEPGPALWAVAPASCSKRQLMWATEPPGAGQDKLGEEPSSHTAHSFCVQSVKERSPFCDPSS